jgi:SAM-dependent methyltransferase
VIDQARRLSFGSVADAYDRFRPDYPGELVDDLIEYAGCQPGAEVLEIGAGTGKATRMFCNRGLSVVAIEPDSEMAAVASRQAATAGHTVRIIQSDFESAALPAGAFSLAFSGQAWHWIEPGIGYARVHGLLRPAGVLAAFWNQVDWSRCPLREELRNAYQESGVGEVELGPMHPGVSSALETRQEWDPDLARSAGFTHTGFRRYERVLRYTAQEYVALLGTHSDHILLDPKVGATLLERTGEIIERHGGVLELAVPTLLCVARV